MASRIEFTRGNAAYHTFAIPASSWTAGGKLFFTAKPAIDDDTTDAAAVINYSWDDSAVSDTTINGVPYKKYDCTFPPSATTSILSNGASYADYLGEFKYVPTSGVPVSFPATDQKLDTVVYFDVRRKNT